MWVALSATLLTAAVGRAALLSALSLLGVGWGWKLSERNHTVAVGVESADGFGCFGDLFGREGAIAVGVDDNPERGHRWVLHTVAGMTAVTLVPLVTPLALMTVLGWHGLEKGENHVEGDQNSDGEFHGLEGLEVWMGPCIPGTRSH